MSTTAPQTRHTVTALIVAHDGAHLLPVLVQALQAQTYRVEQTVGVDTGSGDRSEAVLAGLIGQDAVSAVHRSAGYGEAVMVALRNARRLRAGATEPGVTRVEWLWLLHDDCEPAPDALENLLRAASRDRSVVVVGPKVLDGQDRRTLREVGVAIDRAGRRVTGIDPGEIDQGQHDHKRAVLAVGSAGMLVRRDVWERLGGFDPALRFFRDDVDFCWRVQAAGLRVQVATDAVLYHRELSARRRRPTEGGNARRLDRRNALYVLAVNLPLPTMVRVVGGSIAGSLVRAAYFLMTKQLDLAAAYAFSVLGLFAHPVQLIRGRRRRAAGISEGYYAVRIFIPPARTLFRLAEKIAGLVSNGPPQVTHGRHQATAEESEEDEQFVDQQSVVRRIIAHPGVQLFVALLLIALIAERRLLAASPLGGGALVPAWGGATALWREYLAGFHAVSVGSTASAPTYLAVVAGLATLLGGQAWLAVDVLLLGCVPLAGLTAYLATRWLGVGGPVRVLLAASYALLPVATGAVAAGRLGTAVAFILLPLVAVSAGRMLTAPPRQARRAAWAAGLLIALAAAFAPFAWVLGLLLAAGALGVRRWLPAVDPVNAAIVVVTPFLVLFPWSLHLLASPSALLSEAGLSSPGLTARGLSPTALLALSPGGPGLPPAWVTLGFGLALLALAQPARRSALVIAGWSVAVTGLLAAVVVSRISVTPPAGGPSADGWPGVALALAALGLLLAFAPAAQWLTGIIPNDSGGLRTGTASAAAGHGRSRRALACVALAAAASAPLLVAGYWVKDGVRGPVGVITAPLLPAFVTASSAAGEQYRTLILRPAGVALDYLVVRQGDPSLGEPELDVAPAARAALSRQVAALGAPNGADAGDPGLVLGSFGIRWVLLPGPVDPVLAQRIDASLGLVALNKGSSYDLWQVTGPVSRVRVVAADGTTTDLSSGTVNTSGVTVPASGGTVLLAEPYGGWTATLNGRALKPVATPVNGWAQGFVLPPGGGRLSITRDNLARTLSLGLELVATLAVFLLALPGKRADPVAEAEALAALREARSGKRANSARRATRGASRQAAGGTGRLAFPLGRRAGRAEAAPEPGAEVTGQPARGRARRVARVTAGTRVAAENRVTERAQAAGTAVGTELAEPVRPAAAVATAGHDRHGGRDGDEDDRGAGRESAPWGGESDWGRPGRSGDAWTSDLPAAVLPGEGPGRQDDPARLPGQRASAPESPVSGSPLPETRPPWETGPRRSSWENGPQPSFTPAVPPSGLGTGPHPDSRTDLQPGPGTGPRRVTWSGPQPAADATGGPAAPWDAPSSAGTGSQPVSWTDGESVPGTGPRRVTWSGPQPAADATAGSAPPWDAPATAGTGPRPTSRTESRPAPGTGPQRVSWAGGAPDLAPEGGNGQPGTGTGPRQAEPAQPAERPPWESAGWNGDWGPVAQGDAATPEPRAEPASDGPAPRPDAARPARQERGAHRAAKHGKPSRWRGNRAGGGES